MAKVVRKYPARRRNWGRLLGRIVLAAALIASAAAATGWYLYTQQNEGFLQAMGDFLWVREELQAADIIYVLGGDYESRIPHAAALYKQGLAKKIVVPREDMEREDHFTDTSVRMLKEAGVPESGIQEWKVGRGVRTTADEMRALKLYTEVFPNVRRVIVVTSAYHTRRARYTARRFLWAKSVELQVSGIEKGWRMRGWWLIPAGRREVEDEYRKLFYYVPRYCLGF